MPPNDPTAPTVTERAAVARRSTHHVCLDIRGALDLPKSKLRGWWRADDGRLLSPDEARAGLMDELAKGRRVLPMGGPCEGFDYQTGCPGHPVETTADA